MPVWPNEKQGIGISAISSTDVALIIDQQIVGTRRFEHSVPYRNPESRPHRTDPSLDSPIAPVVLLENPAVLSKNPALIASPRATIDGTSSMPSS